MKMQDYLYSEFDESIVEEFLMLLDIMEDNLDLTIERLYTDYQEAINDLFRMFHNLKSAAGYLKIKRIENFAHFVEDILEDARKENKAKEELIDWLFKVSAQFHEWYNNIDSNEDLAPLNPNVLKHIPRWD
jgi:two-component system chemotaxis sensor kinase CheA